MRDGFLNIDEDRLVPVTRRPLQTANRTAETLTQSPSLLKCLLFLNVLKQTYVTRLFKEGCLLNGSSRLHLGICRLS